MHYFTLLRSMVAPTLLSLRNGGIALIRLSCITHRDLWKELMKKSDGVVRNTLSMMNVEWTDDDIIAKLCPGLLISVHYEQGMKRN